MKIKTRLLLYNAIIIVVSIALAWGAIQFVEISSRKAMQEVEVITTEEGEVYYSPTKPREPKPKDDGGLMPEPFRKSYQELICAIIAITLVVAILAIILSNRFAKRVTKPVKMLEEAAGRVQDGDYTQKIIYTKNDDFAPVIRSFNNMQATLLEKERQAKTYETAKQMMVNGISHDLRTPLTVIKGNLRAVQDGVANTKKKREQYLTTAYTRVTDIENLTNKLFEAFNFETTDLHLNLEKVELGDFVEQVTKQNESVMNEFVRLELELPKEKVFCEIDQAEMKRVFDNLLNNTIKHSGKKIPKVIIKIEPDASEVRLSFADNGRGVGSKNLSRIFDEFYMEDESRNRTKGGSGLGLAIVKKIIESHGGTIKARNHKGLIFEIKLRRADE